MPDLHVVAVIPAKAESIDAVGAALSTLAEQTRAEEGCVAYELFRSETEAGAFVTVERWRSQADIDAHMASPHMATALAAAGDHLAGPPAIHILAPVSGS